MVGIAEVRPLHLRHRRYVVVGIVGISERIALGIRDNAAAVDRIVGGAGGIGIGVEICQHLGVGAIDRPRDSMAGADVEAGDGVEEPPIPGGHAVHRIVTIAGLREGDIAGAAGQIEQFARDLFGAVVAIGVVAIGGHVSHRIGDRHPPVITVIGIGRDARRQNVLGSLAGPNQVAVAIIIRLRGALIRAALTADFLEQQITLVISGCEDIVGLAAVDRLAVSRQHAVLVGVVGRGVGEVPAGGHLLDVGEGVVEDVVGSQGLDAGHGGVGDADFVAVVRDGADDVVVGIQVKVIRVADAAGGRAGDAADGLVERVDYGNGVVAARVNGVGHVAHRVVLESVGEVEAAGVHDALLEVTVLRAAGIINHHVATPRTAGVVGQDVGGHLAERVVFKVFHNGRDAVNDVGAVAARVVLVNGQTAARVGVRGCEIEIGFVKRARDDAGLVAAARAGQTKNLKAVALLEAVRAARIVIVGDGIAFGVGARQHFPVFVEGESIRVTRRFADAEAARELQRADDVAELVEAILGDVSAAIRDGVLENRRREIIASRRAEARVAVVNRPARAAAARIRAAQPQRNQPVGVWRKRGGVVLRNEPRRAADRRLVRRGDGEQIVIEARVAEAGGVAV